MEKLDFLINYLVKERKEFNSSDIFYGIGDKKRLYRSLCNTRPPQKISKEYIKIENEFLKEENKRRGIIDSNNIEPFINYKGTQICLLKGDITTLKVDAIVNAANSQGLGCFVPCHNCIDNQVGTFAGVELRIECNEIMKKKNYNLKTGEAIITNGYNLKVKKIIHTVGPIIYDKVTIIEEEQLKNCYINSLKLASENDIKAIAFPCISTGEFRFPKDLAATIAVRAVKEYLSKSGKSFKKIIFDVFSEEDYKIYLKKLGEAYERI